MDLSFLRKELEEAGFTVPVVEDKDIFHDPSELCLPFLLGSRDSYAVDSFVLKDSNILNRTKVDLNNRSIQKRYFVAEDDEVYKWVLHNCDVIKAVHEKPVNVDDETNELKMGIYCLGFHLRYSKLKMRLSLQIIRTTEMYQYLKKKEAPPYVLDIILKRQNITGEDAVRVLDYLKDISLFIPLFDEGGSGVYFNVGKHTLVPTYGKNIKECKTVMDALSKTYDKVIIVKNKWYYVFKDVVTNKVWLRPAK